MASIEVPLFLRDQSCKHIMSVIFVNVGVGQAGKKCSQRAVVVVKWSACSPSTLAIRIRIPLKSTIFSVQCLKRMKVNKKEAEDGPLS